MKFSQQGLTVQMAPNLHIPMQSVFDKGQLGLLLLTSRTLGSHLCPRLVKIE